MLDAKDLNGHSMTLSMILSKEHSVLCISILPLASSISDRSNATSHALTGTAWQVGRYALKAFLCMYESGQEGAGGLITD
jgi:hypothetical protein